MSEKQGETYTSGAVTQIAGLFQHNECLPNQISVSVYQEQRFDERPWFVPNKLDLLQTVPNESLWLSHKTYLE